MNTVDKYTNENNHLKKIEKLFEQGLVAEWEVLAQKKRVSNAWLDMMAE